jgi:hypothetical protein
LSGRSVQIIQAIAVDIACGGGWDAIVITRILRRR